MLYGLVACLDEGMLIFSNWPSALSILEYGAI
jgi:hypothetical protein